MSVPAVVFGPFCFDAERWSLQRDGEPVVIQDKALTFLAALLERPGALLTREALCERLWPAVFVSDDSLFQVARKARAALGDDPRQPRWIATVQGRGYRFIGTILQVVPEDVSESAPADPAVTPPRPPAPAEAPARPARRIIGREHLLSRLDEELRASPGLWTVTGSGGVGKTTLARALLDQLSLTFSGGAIFCDAQDITDPAELEPAVARALGLDAAAIGQHDALTHALDGLGPALLVVDNLEQLAESAAPLLAAWRSGAPALRVVATSRVRLGVPEERLVVVPPLTITEGPCDDLATLGASPAGRLLLDLAARGDRPLRDRDAPALSELLGALGGLPLAIELAVPRLRVLSPDQLAARMVRQLDLLRDSASGRHPRHAALRSSIAASWALLSPAQQAGLGQLSAFSGPFSADAAEAVMDVAAWPDAGLALDVLGELLDHSLVRRRDPLGQAESALLELLPSVRAFARDVTPTAELAAAERRCDEHYGSPGCFPVPEDRVAVLAQAERANLVAALDRTLTRGDHPLAAGIMDNLSPTLVAHGPLVEAVRRLQVVAALPGLSADRRAAMVLLGAEAGLQSHDPRLTGGLLDQAEALLPDPDPATRGRLAWLRAESLFRLGEVARARAQANAALEAEGLPVLARARLLTLRGNAETVGGDPRAGIVTLAEALRLAEAHGWESVRVRVLLEMGWARLDLGNVAEAMAWWDAAYAYGEAVGDRFVQARVMERRGQALRRQGRLDEAEASLLAAAAQFQRGGFALLEGGCLDQLAVIALNQGQFGLAEARARRSIQRLETSEHGMAAAMARGNLGLIYARMGRLDEACAELEASYERQAALGRSAPILLHNLGKTQLIRGDLASARARVTASLVAHEASGHSNAAALTRASLGQIVLAEGKLDEAEAHLSRSLREQRSTGEAGYGLGMTLGLWGLALARLGRRSAAEEAFAECEAVLGRTRAVEALAVSRCRRARAAAAWGDTALAERLRAEGEEALRRMGLTAQSELGWELRALEAELRVAAGR